jgi:osmotically inducible protein OsmC
MATKQARVSWKGDLESGDGTIEQVGSGAFGPLAVSWPARTGDESGMTSPEELIAAAHSACFAMSLSSYVARSGGTPKTLDVTADVGLGPDPAGGFRLTGITLTVSGDVEGLDADGFKAAAEDAKANCPVSKALTGVDITLDVK